MDLLLGLSRGPTSKSLPASERVHKFQQYTPLLCRYMADLIAFIAGDLLLDIKKGMPFGRGVIMLGPPLGPMRVL
jgi:hypothetical protein